MKHLATLAFLLILLPSKAQTVTSIADGSWNDPATWDCACVPLAGDTITISHAIVMDQSFTSSSGSLVIEAAGSLTGQMGVLLEWGGIFENEGAIDFGHLSLWPNQSAPARNGGSILVGSRLILTVFELINEGSIVSDSLFAGANIMNHVMGTIDVGVYQGISWLTNEGVLHCGQIDVAWVGNAGSVLVDGDAEQFSFYGSGIEVMGNASLYSISTGGLVHIHGDATLNGTSNMVAGLLQVDGDLLVEGDVFLPLYIGQINVGEDLVINGVVDGQGGAICVIDSLINEGLVSGTVDLCDLSPTVLVPPFVDVNSGTIGSGVTFCASGTCVVGVKEEIIGQLVIAPNPANDHVTFEGMPAGAELRIYDGLGQLVLAPGVVAGTRTTMDLGSLPKGIYLATATKGMERLTTRLVVE